MSLSEVFRPSTGDLIVRDNVSNGHSVGVDSFIRERPATHGGYRFGQLSRSQFFTRHNPHPNRVRHFKGLLDVPICSVNDDGQFATSNYSLKFPPNSYNLSKLNQWNGRIPVNSLNVDSRHHQTNSITGLDYFTGLNSYPFKEKAVPKVGLVPINESWRQQLKSFTDQLGEEHIQSKSQEEERPRTTMYSRDTGRLIPPQSRAISRQASRRAQRTPFGGPLQHISADPDVENMVLTMLCQILQTEDTNAVQQWLCSAGDREKSIVMDLIRAAMIGKEEYHNNKPINLLGKENNEPFLPSINENGGLVNGESRVDRLIVESEEQTKPWTPSKPPQDHEFQFYKPVPPPSAFKPTVDDVNDNAVQPPTTVQPTGTWNPFQSVNTF